MNVLLSVGKSPVDNVSIPNHVGVFCVLWFKVALNSVQCIIVVVVIIIRSYKIKWKNESLIIAFKVSNCDVCISYLMSENSFRIWTWWRRLMIFFPLTWENIYVIQSVFIFSSSFGIRQRPFLFFADNGIYWLVSLIQVFVNVLKP